VSDSEFMSEDTERYQAISHTIAAHYFERHQNDRYLRFGLAELQLSSGSICLRHSFSY